MLNARDLSLRRALIDALRIFRKGNTHASHRTVIDDFVEE